MSKIPRIRTNREDPLQKKYPPHPTYFFYHSDLEYQQIGSMPFCNEHRRNTAGAQE